MSETRCVCVGCGPGGHCCGRCHERMTQEDMRCDQCREPVPNVRWFMDYIANRYGTP